MKPKYFLFFCLSVYVLSTQYSTATVRYVSKTGTSTPPYTSWQTASDSIQKCINICVDGDTVYVANGVYYESIYIDKTINLWGSSADSTVINGVGTPNNYILYFSENNSTFKNFTLTSPGQRRTGLANWETNLRADNCRIYDVGYPVTSFNSSPNIENFIITDFTKYAIFDECPNDSCKGIFRNNIIISNGGEPAVNFGYAGTPTFIDNILIEEGTTLTGIESALLRGINLKNNFITGYRWNGMLITEIRTDTAYILNNNLVYNPIDTMFGYGAIAIGTGNRTLLKNNILTNSNRGIYGYQSNDSTKPDYNLFWNVEDLVGGNASLGDSNIVADPMFVNDTIPTANGTYDFHLQKYSPAIDKGDPSIQDVDGSRSDIGMFGGPGGEKYTYLDLPPKTPRNFSYSFDSTNTFLTLKWDMNYESDFKNYKIYRDTIAGFIPSQFNLIGETDTSMILENITEINSNKIYYRVSAVDSQDNESQPGNEIAVIITGVEPGVEILRDYILYQNYPNPFNPSTIISYEIKERAYVKLMVYDIKGELISVMVNKEQNAGYYEVEFNVNSQMSNVKGSLASGIYLYRIEVIGEGRIPVYTEMKKMLMIK